MSDQSRQARKAFVLFAIVWAALAVTGMAGTLQSESGSNQGLSLWGDAGVIVGVTALALFTPFLFAWAGNPRSWQKVERSALVVGTLSVRDSSFRALAAIFCIAVLLQSLHMSEHVAQVIQRFPLGHSEAHGLLGYVFNREWVHLAYNTLYFGLLAVLLVGYRAALSGSKGEHGLFLALLWFVYLFEGYHLSEHVLKVAQFLQWGVEDTPGLAGQFFPGIWVHFIYNLLVYFPLVLAFFSTGAYQALVGPRKRKAPASQEAP